MENDFVLDIVDEIAILQINLIRVTLNDIQEFRQSIDSIITKEINKIIIDFSKCTYIDSSVIGLLITFTKELRKSGGDIKLIVPQNGGSLNIFVQTSLNKIFLQFPDRQKALESFRNEVS